MNEGPWTRVLMCVRLSAHFVFVVFVNLRAAYQHVRDVYDMEAQSLLNHSRSLGMCRSPSACFRNA